MTIADLILSGIVYPVEFIVHAFDLTVNRQLMMIMHGLSWIGIIISSISLVFMNLDKLYFFKFPLRYSQYFTQRRVTTITIISWILSALFVIVAWITKSFRCIDEHCSTLAIFENKIHVYLSFMVIVGIMPTATSLLVGFYIFKVVKTHSKQIAQEAALFQKDDYSKNSKCDNKGSSLVANRLRTFYFIFISSLFTAITLLPYRMIVNPIITLSVLPQYRKRFIRSICFWNVDNANGSDKSLIRTSIGDI
uniref:G_PROTEIN_RECEP_F1_2 domain-containing protein n=1 Tax=Rhabditophanes sp. KR3021 TaxID=114890 RepID=A0AC35UC62_9BILA